MKLKLFILFYFLLPTLIYGQQAISGIVNTYTEVTAIDTAGCRSILTVGNSSPFFIGDKVLVIQMKGAVIDTNNNSNFGSVLNYNGAGNYEFAFIQSIGINTVTLNGNLINYYDANGHIQ